MLVLTMLTASLALVWFFGELRSRLLDHSSSRVAFGSAVIGAAGLAIGAVILFAPSAVQMNGGVAFVGAPVAHTFAQAGLGVMLVVGMYSLALAVGLFSFGLRRTGVIPGWPSIAGLVIAVLLLGSYIWLPGVPAPNLGCARRGHGTRAGQPSLARTNGGRSTALLPPFVWFLD